MYGYIQFWHSYIPYTQFYYIFVYSSQEEIDIRKITNTYMHLIKSVMPLALLLIKPHSKDYLPNTKYGLPLCGLPGCLCVPNVTYMQPLKIWVMILHGGHKKCSNAPLTQITLHVIKAIQRAFTFQGEIKCLSLNITIHGCFFEDLYQNMCISFQ